MILSFHPIIEADHNILCAGREPNADDRKAIIQADAIILSQGCTASLYQMVRRFGRAWFPNLDIRFDAHGKIGQTRLFRRIGAAHPHTVPYDSLADYHRSPWPGPYPAVVKLNWGGEGETVFRADDAHGLGTILETVARFESSGQMGFVLQRYVPSQNRSLRAVVIGDHRAFYWRIASGREPFGTALRSGAHVDPHVEPSLRDATVNMVNWLCRKTGIQLAGLDFIFDANDLQRGHLKPLILEINHFFGRAGLGGSDAYYRILDAQVDRWLNGLGLHRSTPSSE